MTIFHAIFLGLVQGLTEFLPISSSGHLLLFEKLFGLGGNLLFFDVCLHFGTLLAVIIYHKKEVLYLIKHPFCEKAKQLYLASGVTFVLVLIFKESLLSFFSGKILGFCFLVTAILLLVASSILKKNKTKKINYFSSAVIGFSQFVACLPGISRSGTTLATSLILGNEKEESLSFSFLLSIPIILASMVFSLVEGGGVSVSPSLIIIATIFSFLSGLLSISVLKNLLNKNKLFYFALYLIILAVVVFVLF